MVRGKMAIIASDAVYVSADFNGGMDPADKGRTAYDLLTLVHSVKSFERAVSQVNHEYGWPEDMLIYRVTDINAMLDMTKDYADNWFSDYVYIKNLAYESKEIKLRKCTAVLPAGDVGIMYFGRRWNGHHPKNGLKVMIGRSLETFLDRYGYRYTYPGDGTIVIHLPGCCEAEYLPTIDLNDEESIESAFDDIAFAAGTFDPEDYVVRESIDAVESRHMPDTALLRKQADELSGSLRKLVDDINEYVKEA